MTLLNRTFHVTGFTETFKITQHDTVKNWYRVTSKKYNFGYSKKIVKELIKNKNWVIV